MLVQHILVYFQRFENTVRLDKTLQLRQRIRCDMCNVAIESVNRHRERSFHSFYSYALLLLSIYHFGRVEMDEHIFDASKRSENIFDASNLLLMRRRKTGRVYMYDDASSTFLTLRRDILLYFNDIFNATCTFLTRPK